MGYAPEGRLATVTDPDGLIESYFYEPTGELHQLIDRNANTTTIAHDSLGRVAAIVDALGRKHRRTYPVPVGTQIDTAVYSGPLLTSGIATGADGSIALGAALNPGDYQSVLPRSSNSTTAPSSASIATRRSSSHTSRSGTTPIG